MVVSGRVLCVPSRDLFRSCKGSVKRARMWPGRERDATTHLHQLALVVPDERRGITTTRRAHQLPAIDGDGGQSEAGVGVHDPAAVLPLHDARRTFRRGGVGDGAVVGFLVVAVGGEGVGDARLVGLDELVLDRVVEVLPRHSVSLALAPCHSTGSIPSFPSSSLSVAT